MTVERIKPEPMKKIKGQPHLLAYITPNEVEKLKALGGQETMTKEGIPAYPEYDNYGYSSQSDFDAGDRSKSNDPNVRGTAPGQNRVTAAQLAAINAKEKEAARIAKEKLDKRKAKNKNITKFGYNKPKSKLGGILGTIAGMMMGIPGLGLLTGGLGSLGNKLGDTFGNFNETMRGINPVTGKANTQAEYEAMVADRRTQSRIDKMQDRINRGYNQIGFGDFTKTTGPITDNQRATLEGLLGQKDRFGNQFSPSTAQNVLTGRDLKGFTPSRMGLQMPTAPRSKPTFSDPFRNTVGTTANTTNDAVSSATPINNLQQRVDVMNQFDLPLNYSPNDLQAAAKRAMTQPRMQIELAPYEKGVPQELQFFDGRPFTAKAYDPYKVNTQPQGSVLDAQPKKGILQMISDAFISPAGAAEIMPAIKTQDTGLGFSVPTGDVGLNTSGRLGNLSATVDAIDALKGESVNPELNYSGNFGNTNVYGNYSDDVQNLGLNFNNNRGLYGGVEYDAITGEPRANIGFRRTFADGGLASMFTRRG